MPMDSFGPETGLLVADRRSRAAVSESIASLPAIGPGQIWLVELHPDRPASSVERRVLEAANVIIYDRTLAATVAEILPLGLYAEPAPPAAEAPDAAMIDRCVRFARDGWSVVRAVVAGTRAPNREARQHAFAARLRTERIGGEPAMRVFTGAGGDTDERAITVFAAPVAALPSPIAANGLAG
ncbi:MAG TPA: hypothetical protein VND87_09115 [Stellaceae bacterium]|nr:hypothetical protein [Stellaceae bacterium]